MAILKKFIKQPIEEKDYDVSYEAWLTKMGDTILDVDVHVECLTDPDNVAMHIADTIFTYSKVKIWLKGGTDGNRYKVSIDLFTLGGRLDQSELIFTVRDY